jgi:NAD(P)-dependent dehydrogenase (short-subunit alcohol dehydrogenase family)
VTAARLAGAHVVVTGAGSGIGLATALLARDEGARVAGLDLDVSRLDGADVRAVRCDVTESGSLTGAVAAAAAALGGIDGVVAAAGIGGEPGDCVSLPLEAWTQTLAVNLTGVFLTARATVPHLRAAGGGSLVLIASQLGLVAAAGSAAYCASKGGVVLLGKALALDHAAEGIRVNVVCPGPIETPMLARWSGAVDREALVERSLPIGRIGRPEEVAALTVHLLSGDAGFMTGSVVAIDGGWTAQ